MSRPARGDRPSRISPASWLGAVAVHAAIVGLFLQFGSEPARSNIPPRPDVEAVRVQAADEQLLQQKREAHRRALREAELRKQREREARRKAEQEARRKAEEEKKKVTAQAEAKRKAKEEAERKRAEKRKREEEARRKAEEERRQAAERAEAERKAEEARKLKAAEQRAQARREEQAQRRQREAARRARQADIWRIAIKKKIERVWLRPPAAGGISPCEVVVEQDEKGEVLSAQVQGCRASQAWQDSLRNAVVKASPLPRPPEPDLFDRRLVITFHPKAAR